MKLTFEKTEKEEIDIDLSTPVYRKLHNSIYYKFYTEEDKNMYIRVSDLLGTELHISEVFADNCKALALRDDWEECTEEEFKSFLMKQIKQFTI